MPLKSRRRHKSNGGDAAVSTTVPLKRQVPPKDVESPDSAAPKHRSLAPKRMNRGAHGATHGPRRGTESSQCSAGEPLALRCLTRAELPVDTTELARFLVGKILVRELRRGGKITRLAGRIVETEAYPIGDAAGHHFRGERPRTRAMFGPHGHAYVFFNYGSAWMMNVTSEIPGVGGGILIRAIEPLEGIDRMMRTRGVTRVLDVARGPGRLAQAMQIDKRLDGVDLCSPEEFSETQNKSGTVDDSSRGPAAQSALWLADDGTPQRPIGITTRIGLSQEAHRPLRFYELGSPFVSGPRHLLK